MKKFPSNARLRGTFPRTVIVSRRGGGSASFGDQTFYVASVPGGKTDLELSFIGGVPQSLTATGGRSLELFNYALGTAGAFNAGFGWDGAGLLVAPYLRRVSEEMFETYDLGAITESALTGGLGWNGTAALLTPYVRVAGEESFESYDLGGTSEAALTGGTGWNGGAALHAY